jgi:hypothetical protein
VKAEYGDKRFGVKKKNEKCEMSRPSLSVRTIIPSEIIFFHLQEWVAAAEIASRQRID